jgi:RNA polymerase sigma-70 factor (ECF subfamily)
MQAGSDKALLERAQKSAVGFGELFDAYYDRIYAYAYRRVGTRMVAEDIAAGVFEDALRSLRRVRWQGKPVIAWLYRIAARRVVDYYRSTRDAVEFAGDRLGAAEDGQGELEIKEEYAAVRRGLACLKERDREVIQLAFFDDLDGAEIAATLNCTPNNVYVRLHRALKKLETLLKDERAPRALHQEMVRWTK